MVFPVVEYDEVMEIKEFEGKRKIRFLTEEEKISQIFSPALTVYSKPFSSHWLSPWQMLESNADLAGLVDEGLYPVRWYRLKIVTGSRVDPILPWDDELDDVVQFVTAHSRVESVSYMKLKRDEGKVLVPDGVFYPHGEGNFLLDNGQVPLEGFWGRRQALNVSDANVWKPSVVVPHAQVYRLWAK